MKGEQAIRSRAEAYRECLRQGVEQRLAEPGPDPDLDLVLLELADRLAALLWVLGELEDDLLDPAATLH